MSMSLCLAVVALTKDERMHVCFLQTNKNSWDLGRDCRLAPSRLTWHSSTFWTWRRRVSTDFWSRHVRLCTPQHTNAPSQLACPRALCVSFSPTSTLSPLTPKTQQAALLLFNTSMDTRKYPQVLFGYGNVHHSRCDNP